MSYDIGYYSPETWDKNEKQFIQVAPYESEGGTVRAEIKNGKLHAAKITDCDINITYNYSPFYREHIDLNAGIRWIYGKTGAEVQERLTEAVRKLGIERSVTPFWQIDFNYTGSEISEKKREEYRKVEDWDAHPDKDKLVKIGYLRDGGAYWKPTPGNAGYALMRILNWIIQNPNGVFEGD